jgi:anti-anti-sigma factor
MATHITQHEQDGCTILRVEGDLMFDDALVLEKLSSSMAGDGVENILIDLADLDFLDSESAPVLRRISGLDNVRIEGMEIFLQTVIDEVEKRCLPSADKQPKKR